MKLLLRPYCLLHTILEDVFSSLVCGRAKSELSTHSVSLCATAHLRVVVSAFSQGCLPWVHHHIVFYLPSVQLYRSSTIVPHWLVYCNHSHFAQSNCCCPLCVLILLVHSFPCPQRFSSQDDGRSPLVDHHSHIRLLPAIWCHLSLTLYLMPSPPISSPSCSFPTNLPAVDFSTALSL